MITLQVELGLRSYPIHIGRDLLADGELWTKTVRERQLLVVTNDRVGPLYLDTVRDHLPAEMQAVVVLKDGEQYKTLESFETIITALLDHQFERGCALIALGGGVVGDITGFAAACYQRGVSYYQAPTTLLAQVDSSVGGKTAVNHALGKNMVGAFHQPSAVIADVATLETLARREYVAGIAEIIKYGLIRDREFFVWLEEHMEALVRRDDEVMTYAIRRSCENKAAVVAADEKEAGLRALLNLGHTFGHAIETGLGYGVKLHGEAVGIGMAMAADLSRREGMLSDAEGQRIIRLIERAGLDPTPPALAPDSMEAIMRVDKKNRDGRIRLVLLESIGSATIMDDYDPKALRATLEHRRRRA
jgi:3-dehydroquinate synthase